MAKNVTKQLIINTTLQMIDANNGIKDVTLRSIAKEIVCAHTNFYNYYSSLNDIFWDSLGSVILTMMHTVAPETNDKTDSNETILLLLANLIDFYIEHPGWYKLIWFEDIQGTPPPSVQEILKKPGSSFIADLMMNNCNDFETAQRYSDILLQYVHGEMSSWINHRNDTENRDDIKQKIMQNARYILNLLINSGGIKDI